MYYLNPIIFYLLKPYDLYILRLISLGINSNSKYNYLQRVQSFRGLYLQKERCCRRLKTIFTEGGYILQRPYRGLNNCIYKGEGVVEALQRPYSSLIVALQTILIEGKVLQRRRYYRGLRTIFIEEGLYREEELALQRPYRLYLLRGGYYRAIIIKG